MTAKKIEEMAWLEFPYTCINSRGHALVNGQYIRYGIPTPIGKKEKPDDMKGGDRIGFKLIEVTPEMVGKTIPIFTSVEIKTINDNLKTGQIRWHNWILKLGGISEIWKETKKGLVKIKRNI